MMAERDTAVIKAAKTFLQMFIIQCFSVRKLQHESYQRHHIQSYYGVSKDKQIVTNEIRE